MVDFHAYYRGALVRQRRHFLAVAGVLLVVFMSATAAKHALDVMAIGGLVILAAAAALYRRKTEKYRTRLRLSDAEIPVEWHITLIDHSTFYNRLSDDDKQLFARRVMFLLADVRIEGVETEIDDEVKLIVAAAAVIPTFAFPYFEYPNLRNVLVYADAFNERFETDSTDRDDEHSSGMVGTGFMNYSVLLSRRDLLTGFSGTRTTRNVGVHEFVHLLDKADGSTDGVPAILMDPSSITPWLELMDREMEDLERGRSDIDPYALTDRAEFFAVVSEFFFNNPEKFRLYHPELYNVLCSIFQQDPGTGETIER